MIRLQAKCTGICSSVSVSHRVGKPGLQSQLGQAGMGQPGPGLFLLPSVFTSIKWWWRYGALFQGRKKNYDLSFSSILLYMAEREDTKNSILLWKDLEYPLNCAKLAQSIDLRLLGYKTKLLAQELVSQFSPDPGESLPECTFFSNTAESQSGGGGAQTRATRIPGLRWGCTTGSGPHPSTLGHTRAPLCWLVHSKCTASPIKTRDCYL